MHKIARLLAAGLALAAWGATGHAQMTGWGVRSGAAAPVTTPGGVVSLALDKEGMCVATGPQVTVKPGESMVLSFKYGAENLRQSDGIDATELGVTVTWYNAEGKDIDERLLALGFPPKKRLWTFDKNGELSVADNVMPPELSSSAKVSFALRRLGVGMPAKATISNVTLVPGQVEPKSVELPDSGPADAGPLSSQSAGFAFGSNLVPNATFEDGDIMPTAWTLLGDNSQGAALWRQGGAYSGKRCLQIFDRGPTIKSWDNRSGLYVPGGAPTPSTAASREEVSARFASEPAPVVTGAYYQASAMLWYLRRVSGESPPPINSIHIQFLDADGKTLPSRLNEEDWMPSYDPVVLPGWRMTLTHPVPAPANAKSVRVVVALVHAKYYIGGPRPEIPVKIPEERGFVLVDNIALYRVPVAKLPSMSEEPSPLKTSPGVAYQATVKAGLMPFVPTSPAHRPNSMVVETEAERPCGVIVSKPGKPKALWLHLVNALGDVRPLEIGYDILDWEGKTVLSGKTTTEVRPFEDTRIELSCPATLPYGPYRLRYTVSDSGHPSDSGESRFAVIRPNGASYEEKGRMDYPFGSWAWILGGFAQSHDEANLRALGELNQMAGVGKQGFCSGFGLGGLETLPPDKRAAEIGKQVAVARAMSDVVKRFGMHNILSLTPADAPVPATNYPALSDAMRQIVAAMKDQVKVWIYSDEYINGEVTDLDVEKHPDGSKVMGWGRLGTGRQFWGEYFACYDGAKQADPDCVFGPESASDASGNVLRLFFEKLDHRKRLDFFGINMFGSVFTIWPPQIMELEKVGMAKLPLCGQNFVSFSSAPATGPTRVREEAEAVRLMTTYYAEALNGFPQLFFLPQWGWTLSDEPGSFTYLKRARPQYVAYANMTDCLGAGTFIAKHELPGGLLFVRERSVRRGLVGVVWSTAAGTTAELEVGSRSVEVSDVWGNRRVLKAAKGIVQIPLTPMPQYILGAKRLKPAPSVNVTLSNSSLNPLAPEVTVTIANGQRAPVRGTLALLPESAIGIATAAQAVEPIAPGASKSFRFQVSPIDRESDKPLALRAQFTVAGRAYEAVDALNFHLAIKAATPPTIDGALTEWDELCPFVGNREEQIYRYNNQKPWGGPDEFSGRLWMRWDQTNLYLSAKVRDRNFNPALALQDLWSSDAIEMAFDLTGSLSKSAKVTQIAVGQTRDGKNHVQRYLPKVGELTDARVAIARSGMDTLIEAAIPWKDLSPDFAAKPGVTISGVFGFNDPDEGLRMMSWFNKVSGLDAAGFGRIRLVDAPPSGVVPPVATNLLTNGSFEDAAQAPGPGPEVTGWSVAVPKDKTGQPTGKVTLVNEGLRGGRCLRIERIEEGEAGLGVNAAWRVSVKPGEIYLLRAMAKGPQPTFWIAPLRAGGGQIEGMAWVKPITPATTTAYGRGLYLAGAQLPDRGAAFAPVAAVFEIPAAAVSIQINLNANWQKGTVCFDDVELFRLVGQGQ